MSGHAVRERERFAERCREAGVDDRRFIDVVDGEKGTRTPGHQNAENWLAPDSRDLAGNYGVHPGPGRDESATWLIEFDIDDYDQERDRSALEELPETLAVKSPHTEPDDPGHLYFAVTGEVASTLREVAGNLNPEPVWGEVKSKGKYVVGPGSQLDGCTKEWCDDCAEPDGGFYAIAADVPIATITADDLADVLRNDPDIQGRTRDSSGHVLDEDGEIDGRGWVGDEADPPEDLPMCYRAALSARGSQQASVSSHKVNVYIGLLGLNCGYEVGEVVDHISEVDPEIDRSETKYHLEHIEDKKYSPPALSTLARAGILPAPICHGECPIHVENDSGDRWLDDPEHVVVSNSPVELARQNVWDWQHADQQAESEADTSLSIDEARERTTDAEITAYQNSDRVIIDALPTTGKSYGAFLAAMRTGTQISYLTGRGNEEQYQRAKQRCERLGLSYVVLPSVYRDCPCFSGEHGDDVKEDVRSTYTDGATAKEIHIEAEDHLGYELPCQHDGETCPWSQWWSSVDLSEYDVVIGYYTHAFIPSVYQQRTVVFDEFVGDAFVTTLGGGSDEDKTSGQLPTAVTHFLSHTPALQDLGLETYSDVMAARHDDEVRSDGIGWLDMSEQSLRDPGLAFAPGGHALAPLATLVLLAGAENDLDNGWEQTTFTSKAAGDGVGIHDAKSGAVRLLTPPDIPPGSGLVCLDGTPTQELWELATGQDLNHRQVLTDAERVEYLRETLDHRYVMMSGHVKPYSSGEYVNEREDAALLEYINEQEDEKPALITSQNALGLYDRSEDVDIERDRADDGWEPAPDSCISSAKYYGNLIGSNDLKFARSLAVIGSPSFGDEWIEKWGAFAGEGVERSGKGVDLEYSGIGASIHDHMTKHQVMQAAMRAGRDGRGATVYIGTCMTPDILDEAKTAEGRVIKTRREGERDVLEALRDRFANGECGWSTQEIADHPAVSIEIDQVRNYLNALHDRGYLGREFEGRDGGGCGYAWTDRGLHQINDHGEIELDPVVATPGSVEADKPAPGTERPPMNDTLEDEAIDRVHRMSVYTPSWIYSPRSRNAWSESPTDERDQEGNRGGLTLHSD